MDRLVHFAAVVVAAGLTAPGRLAAADDPTAALPAHLMSAHVLEMLNAARPKLGPVPTARPGPMDIAPTDRVAPESPGSDIVRLPNYIVRERRPPATEETLSETELAKVAMKNYLGPETGIDRGVLNLFQIATLWRKIPVLGRYRLVDFETNPERALRIYKDAKRAEEWANLTSLLSPALKPGAPPPKK
jgi:hypothetical protein